MIDALADPWLTVIWYIEHGSPAVAMATGAERDGAEREEGGVRKRGFATSGPLISPSLAQPS